MENRNALEILHWLAGDFYNRLKEKKDKMVREGDDIGAAELNDEMLELKHRTNELYQYKKTVK